MVARKYRLNSVLEKVSKHLSSGTVNLETETRRWQSCVITWEIVQAT